MACYLQHGNMLNVDKINMLHALSKKEYIIRQTVRFIENKSYVRG